MSIVAAHASAPRSATTYAQLTRRAARCIARAHVGALTETIGAPQVDASDVHAHRDLAAALVHLGQTLARPLPSSSPAGSGRRRGGPDARLLRALGAVARPRDWSEPEPGLGSGAALAEAARLIRSAADLWATHHGADGRPRSPEASRLRHPSTLGAASREWRTLVALAAQAAEALAEGGRCPTLSDAVVADLREFPRPAGDSADRAAAAGVLDLTVARPGIRRGQPPLDEVSDRVARLHHLAWTLAEAGSAPVTVHANLAAIGMALHRAAASAHRSLAQRTPKGPGRNRHLAAADGAAAGEAHWGHVADQLRALRTPHPSAHPIQIERLDIDRLLSRATRSGMPQSAPELGWALSRIAESFAGIAAHNARALRAAQDRGDLLLVGRAIPTEVLPRRPDLLSARLADQVIPAPTAVVNRLESSYRAIARQRGTSLATPPGQSPAAPCADAP